MASIEIDGATYELEDGMSVLDVAGKNNIDIPTLCHSEAMGPYGSCRLCIVEIQTPRGPKLVASCTYPAMDGLTVATTSEKVKKSRKMTIELLLARCPEEEVLIEYAKEYGVEVPRFREKDDNCILCGLCVRMCQRMGVNAINFQGRGIDKELETPYMEKSDVCMTCGACAFICPTSRFTQTKVQKISGNTPIPILSEFDENMGGRHAVFFPFPQAVPKIPVIDQTKCVYYQTGNCKTCEAVCEAGAISYDQEEQTIEVEVGSVVVSAGAVRFDASKMPQYGYGMFKNVITSLEFERVLSASGPTGGHIIRPSDQKEPKKIAFIQCVGSRDHKTHTYCSSVCCTYAIKEAIIAKEHSGGEISSHIYAMDVRTFGRGFEDYRIRAENEYGVKIIKNNRVPSLEQLENGNLLIKRVEDDKVITEDYDMVILSIGFETDKHTKELAAKLGIELNEHGFCQTSAFEPLSTSKPGIFVCGSNSAPKDIPETVAQASGAAAMASSIISEERGTLVSPKVYPDELEVAELEPRIGVFICHCGSNIGGIVDVPAVAAYARTLPNVVYSTDNLYTCSQDTQDIIKDIILEHKLNRVVIASCSPRTHESLFQDTIQEAGLNKYLFEMANIRDQCSWVHMKEPENATEKSKTLVNMAVARSALLQPLYQSMVETKRSAVVLGGGLAGMTAAVEISKQGFPVDLVEASDKLGGQLNHIHSTITGDDPKALLERLVSTIEKDQRITTHMGTKLEKLDGYLGNFASTLADGATVEHGVLIVATGGREYKPKEYFYGESPKVMTQLEFKALMDKGELATPKNVAIIHCVGARNDENTECGRICCTTSIKTALEINEAYPEANIYNLYKDIRTYGFKEAYYKEAGEKGINFIRYDEDLPPQVTQTENGVQIRVKDQVLKRDLLLNPDIVILSSTVVPNQDNNDLAMMLKVPVSKDGFFLEAHVKLRPLDFATDGIFICGMAQGPKFMDETISQACGAVSRACTILSKKELKAGGIVSLVNEDLCGGCGTCETVCPYNAITVDDSDPTNLKASVNDILCKACGCCCAACPEMAVTMSHYSDKQILAQIKALSREGV